MIKGIRVGGTGTALSYLDTLVVPIIENTPNEEDLKDSMAQVCEASLNIICDSYLIRLRPWKNIQMQLLCSSGGMEYTCGVRSPLIDTIDAFNTCNRS